MRTEDIIEIAESLFGGDEWPKPLNVLKGLLFVRRGFSVEDAARAAKTSAAKLRKVVGSETAVRDVLALSEPANEADELRRIRGLLGQLLLGQSAEAAFEGIYKSEIGSSSVHLVDLREKRTDTDYRLVNGHDRPIYRINIKFHGTQFRRAAELVHLSPEDCFPLATYKIFGALQKQEEEHLPYIFAIVSGSLPPAEEIGSRFDPRVLDFVLMTKHSRISRKRDIEEAAVSLLRQSAPAAFASLIQQSANAGWYVLSARKADRLLRDKLFDRVFALRIPGFNRQFARAELDMHFSLTSDMTPLNEFLRTLRSEGETKMASLLERGTI